MLNGLKCGKSRDVIVSIYNDSFCLSVILDSLCGYKKGEILDQRVQGKIANDDNFVDTLEGKD